jgi:hypothetical protein
MLTALCSFFGVSYWDWLFCALDLDDGAGDEVACGVGVFGRSCEDSALCRLTGAAREASSSTLGRFSAVLVAVAPGLVLGTGVDVADGSKRRAAIFGIGLTFFCTGSSTTFVRILTGDSLGASWVSFFSAGGARRLGGKRRICLRVARPAFENLSMITLDFFFSSSLAGGAV